jgi:hypothetical protein
MRILLEATRLLLLLALAGCATTDHYTISPGSLRKPQQVDCVVLLNKTKWVAVRGLFGRHEEEGLEAGAYRADWEDDEGTYYLRDGRAIWHRSFSPSDPTAGTKKGYPTYLRQGGIWMPKDKSKKARVYYYIEDVPYEVDFITYQTMSNTSPGTSPIAVGAGAAIATQLLAVAAAADVGKLFVTSTSTDPEFLSAVRSTSKCPQPPE